MKKIIIIGISALVIVGFVVAFWISNSKTPSTNTTDTQNVDLPISGSTDQNPSTPGQGSDLLSLTGVDGSVVRTLNFIKDPMTARDPINPGYYYLGYHVNEGVKDATATENPPYTIQYIASTQYFTVTLLQEPIEAVRRQAEQYLMTHLGVPQNDLCRLKYIVGVPWRVNQVYASRNLGFSFCPGATLLPQ
jgi:hypothetical protein